MGPIEACQHFDIFDDELIQRMRTYYESIGTYRSPVMNKADPGKALKWVEPFLYKLYPNIGRFLGGNFYRHRDPYYPHIDHQPQWPLAVNFLIPIYFEGPPVDLIVFDQRWHMSESTRSAIDVLTKSFREGDTKMEPTDGFPPACEIEGFTGRPIDEEFWCNYLHYGRRHYYGLSGKAFPFAPKSLIMFETKHIHCTGKFHNGNKLGLTLRYSIKQEEA